MGTVIFIGGPTASGKSHLGMDLASSLNTIILSADSRQVYRGMDIGTAKPTMEEQARVQHHLIDIRDPDEPYNVGQFEQDALDLLTDKLHQHEVILVVGGTGLYLKALRHGLDHFPSVSGEIRQSVRERFETEGLHSLQVWLTEIDPQYARQVDMANPHRLMRAIAVTIQSGLPYSSFLRNEPRPRSFRILPILLEPDRSWLYERIDHRVLAMIEQGLVEEVQRLTPFRHQDPLRTVGYQELFEWMDGRHTLEDAVKAIQQHTRQFAKRQLTWFRKESDWIRLNPTTDADLTRQVMALI